MTDKEYLAGKEKENNNFEDWNSGLKNSGYGNSGHNNSGNKNSGRFNSGNENSGNKNSGHKNSGDYNSGNWNSGNWNSGNGYKNFFCTETRCFLFDIEVPSKIIDDIRSIPIDWFSLENKTYHEAWEMCPEEVLQYWAQFPEFQTSEARRKFKEITGRELPKKDQT